MYGLPQTGILANKQLKDIISQECYYEVSRWLAVIGTQPPARQEELGAADSGTEQGGSGCQDIRADLLGGGTIGPSILEDWYR